MTQKEAKLLVEIITKVVRKELGAFKKQLLQEGYTERPSVKKQTSEPINNLSEVHKNFRKTFKSGNSNNRNRPLSKDPILNSILQDTVSIEEAEREAAQLGLLEQVNLPVDANGRIISSNANVNHVIEAMNRDYSGMFKQKQGSKPSAPVASKSQLRSDFMAMMEGDDYGVGGEIDTPMPAQPMSSKLNSGYPSVEPFSGEEEDMDWLNEVG